MTPILHHYAASPFAELVRTAFGLKAMAWQSVSVPNILPKPGQTELTGGYARTPVVQIGADIYCDTGAILPALEALQPSPSFYPAPLGAAHRMLASWAGGPQFLAHVGAAMGAMPPGALPDAFIADRKARFGLDVSQLSSASPHLAAQALTSAQWLSDTLADGRDFVGGAAAGHADLALYSNIWFVRAIPFAKVTSEPMLALPHVAGWIGRMARFGHGSPTEISADDAIAIAKAATPRLVGGSIDAPFAARQMVAVRGEGSGDTPVTGQLARLDSGGITVLREAERAGLVAVHLPRLGQVVSPV